MEDAPSLSIVDFVVIFLYFITIIAVGFLGARFSKTKEDYLVAGRRLSFPLFFGCMAAMALGGGSTVGSTGLGYQFGFGGIWLNLSIGLGLALTGLLIASKLSKLRALSVNEVVERSYGPTARVFSSVLTLVYTLALSVTQVLAIGTVIHGILGTNPIASIAAGGGIVVAYTLVGGMWSVTMTDLVQFIVKTVGVVILAPLFCIIAAGGWDTLVGAIPQEYLSPASMGFDRSFAYVVLYVPGLIIGQDIWQRIFTAKNDRVSKRGTIGAGLYSIVYAFATVIIGMSAFALLPHLDNPEDAFVMGVSAFLPEGVRGVILAAAMAAAMSVSSGTILASSTVLYNDLYKRFINTKPAGMREISVTRICVLIVGTAVMMCALWINDVLAGIDISYGYLSGCVFVPLMASFVLKRFSPKAGLASLATSAIVVTVCFATLGVGSSVPIIAGMASGLASYILANMLDTKDRVDSPLGKPEKQVAEGRGTETRRPSG
ncbi:sodium:solute symporter [Rubneribacter badeniensis]|uniref:Sodium:solute symporter n=1 Tax=Rubneribacter badeniensis TaxID=2070688 RepID=A0A2K2U5G4_9ACTN|nr:sodium:solute symporter [Rubneribacter badeniensis]PNV65547.1 sodium:solute symporter [Rubneribacter badeniensis]